MRDFWRTALRPVHLPLIDKAEDTLRELSPVGRALFILCAGVCILSSVSLLYLANRALLVAIPAQGGNITEGIIGSPRFINPVLAVSDADNDLTSLVYSGLLKATPDGYEPNLAQSYTISPDGMTYTFTLRQNATFQDGAPVTADDVVYTIQKIQDPVLKSPQEANWQGVTVTKIDPRTVQFTLQSPYAPFLDDLTVGILPEHLWGNVSDDEFPYSDLNTSPVGSGPFEVSNISRTSSGIPSSYNLTPFGNYTLGSPYIDINLQFYQNEEDLVSALQSGAIDTAGGLSPTSLAELSNPRIVTAPEARVFAVFFNQNQSAVLRDPAVRQALNDAVNRSALISQVLDGYAVPLDGPLPQDVQPSQATSSALIAAARQELLNAGWVVGPGGVLQKTTGKGKEAQTTTLSFTLATGDVSELSGAAKYLQQVWEQMGASVTVNVYDQGDLSENVIRPRNFDALLFGEVVGRGEDLYAFWDSSQRNDPGLNVSSYANSTADNLLEQLRQTNDPVTQETLLNQFDAQLQKDMPAVFLYAPEFVYTVPKDLAGLNLGLIDNTSDRFLSAPQWHLETDYVWPLFAGTR